MSWLSPSRDVWEKRYGTGTFPWGVFGKACKRLFKAMAEDTSEEEAAAVIAAHLGVYLEQTPAQFINLWKFAQTFKQYEPRSPEQLVDEFGCLTKAGMKLLGVK